jgi:NAD(P)-dependent dehydrogenase (short-subunit alcohol dehydrogenase family)
MANLSNTDDTTGARYPSLTDRSVLVTGGATGIGAELVQAFARQGSRVGFIDLNMAAGDALAKRLAAESGVKHAPAFALADVTDLDVLRQAIGSLRSQCGPFTALINNAANDQRHAFESTSSEQWDAGIAVNLKHQFFAAQAVREDMRGAGGGSIVNLGSISWMLKMDSLPVYTIAKCAVQGLTKTLARALGPHRIRVNSVVPGWVMTDRQLEMWVDDRAKEVIARTQCINAPVLPCHVASMVLFLAADDSAMCTAQEFVVDAGAI